MLKPRICVIKILNKNAKKLYYYQILAMLVID